jgi:hypothetical protein
MQWLGSGDHVIPFLLGINEQLGLVVSSGKGRAFTALDLTDGSHRWQTVVDQTVTAARMADDGSVVGATVGGMAYGINADGSLRWTRRYGGVGHNGVHYTSNGHYALLGGPNPTLFDSYGNILWQREKDAPVAMTGPAELDTGGANAVWVSEDASLVILGGDDGEITFYQGQVKTGGNDYSQLSGFELASELETSPPPPPSSPSMPPASSAEPSDEEQPTTSPAPPPPSSLTPATLPATPSAFNWPLAGGILGGVIVVGLAIIILIKRKAH